MHGSDSEESNRNKTSRGAIPRSYKNPRPSYLHGVLKTSTLANEDTGKRNVTLDDVVNDTNKLGEKRQDTKGGLQGSFTKAQGTYLQSITN